MTATVTPTITLTECLLGVRPVQRTLHICKELLSSNSTSQDTCPYFPAGSTSVETVSHLPDIPELENGRAGVIAWVCVTPELGPENESQPHLLLGLCLRDTLVWTLGHPQLQRERGQHGCYGNRMHLEGHDVFQVYIKGGVSIDC
jgi:hypothetical protein